MRLGDEPKMSSDNHDSNKRTTPNTGKYAFIWLFGLLNHGPQDVAVDDSTRSVLRVLKETDAL